MILALSRFKIANGLEDPKGLKLDSAVRQTDAAEALAATRGRCA